MDQTSFPNRAVKTISVATHLFRGIILNTRKNLRWGTCNSMKLSKWDYVKVQVGSRVSFAGYIIDGTTQYPDPKK